MLGYWIYNSFRIRTDVAERFQPACRANSLSSSGFAGPVRSWTFINHSSRLQTLLKTINYKMVNPYLSWHNCIAKTYCDVPLAFRISVKVNVRLTIIQRWKHAKTIQSQLGNCIYVWHQLYTGFNRIRLYRSITCYIFN